MGNRGTLLVFMTVDLLFSTVARGDTCSTVRQQDARIQDQLTELEINYPLFTAGLEACARQSKDDTGFSVCALAVCAIDKTTCRAVAMRIVDLALQKARADQIATASGCPVSQSGAATPVEFTNSCGHPVQLAVLYQNPAGQWDSEGWWSLSYGQKSMLRLPNGNLVSTNNQHMYYYAETTDGSGLKWNGNIRVNINGQPYTMRELSGGKANLICDVNDE